MEASGLALPAAILVGLPIGHLEAAVLGVAPARARRRKRVRVLAVDQKAHRRAIGIVGMDGDQDRLVPGFRITPGAVRQEALVIVGPQMAVERLDPLLR